MKKTDKIYIAGHSGMVGSALMRCLVNNGYENIITRPSAELDLRNQQEVETFFQKEKPSHVFLSAAKVGGILANNTFRAQFIYDNLQIQNNVIHSSYLNEVTKLLFLGSSCIYPKFAEQPINEDALLTGKLEETNEPYAIAKIAGIKMCEAYRRQYGCNFISVMPTNSYGPNDNYDPEHSHVLPALIRKFHDAKISGKQHLTIWGTGKARREFIYVDDLAGACLFLMNNYNEEGIINIGTGEDITIADLALLIKEIIGFEGEIKFDKEKPDGTPRKLLDVSRLNKLGYQCETKLRDGIESTYEDYLQNKLVYSR